MQILATSLLVAVPASFFISYTRPMEVLEKRLHMVGTVLCGSILMGERTSVYLNHYYTVLKVNESGSFRPGVDVYKRQILV